MSFPSRYSSVEFSAPWVQINGLSAAAALTARASMSESSCLTNRPSDFPGAVLLLIWWAPEHPRVWPQGPSDRLGQLRRRPLSRWRRCHPAALLRGRLRHPTTSPVVLLLPHPTARET